jgi:rhodanese-related sulfurtransferase
MDAPAPQVPGRLSVEELDGWRRQGVTLQLVDVREPWEVEICAIEGALNIPLRTLPDRLGDVAGDRPVVVLCHHGARSQNAVDYLTARGYPSALNLAGGIDAWARRIDPEMATY